MTAAYTKGHFNREGKEVTFLLGEGEFTQRATLGVLQRIEARFGAAAPLANRLARQDVTIVDVVDLLGLVLRDHKDAPKKPAMIAAIEGIGLAETMGALAAFIGYGISADMPPDGQPEGND